MATFPDYYPRYSHGGGEVIGWPKVPGNVAGAGRPVMIWGATQCTTISICCNGGDVNVQLQGNQGLLDDTQNPPADEWFLVWSGSMADGERALKSLPYSVPLWRTVITGEPTGVLTSSIAGFVGGGRWYTAKYPTRVFGATDQTGI